MTHTPPVEFQGRLAAGKDWREIVAWVGDLPPMPQVASKAVILIEKQETSAQELTEVLSKDVALTARVLKIANSAMFARQREITTLAQAIMIIGFKALKGVIVAATIRQMNKTFTSLDRLVWEKSMCSAMAATLLSKKLRKRYVEEIFLLGLLHSLGQTVLLAHKETTKEYPRVLAVIKGKGTDFVSAEQEVLGFAHPLIGALVAKKWNFSPETCQIILHYADPVEHAHPEGEMEEKTAVVQLAECLSHLAGVGSPPGYPYQLEHAHMLAAYVGFEKELIPKTIESAITELKNQFAAERGVYE